tara:strand:- start:2251 stop:3321 length:1071 start_codon:yes stop_codon:yes gene_type:complete
MDSRELVKSFIKISLLILIIYLTYELRLGILYLFISLILTLIVSPVNKLFLNRVKVGNTFSSLISISVLISFFSLLIGLFVPVLIKQGNSLSLLNTKEFRGNLEAIVVSVTDYFESQQLSILEFISDLNIMSEVDFSFVTKLFNSIISQIGSLSIGILSVLFITFFLLKDGNKLLSSLLNLLPVKERGKINLSLSKIENLLSRYFTGVLLQITILFIFYLILLLVLGIENSFAIAFICAILNIIPYLGPIISIILMIILSVNSNLDSFIVNDFIYNSIYLFLGFSFIQLIDNFFLQPYIFSSSIKSHPLEVFIVILSSGLLFGVLGLIIAIPFYTSLKVVFLSFFDIRKIISDFIK